jgi:hypothetical protein
MKNQKKTIKFMGVLILILITSCSPAKRLERFYVRHPELKPQSSVEIKTEYIEKTVYRDTTIYITLPPDTVEKEVIVKELINVPVFTSEKVKAETNLARAESWIENTRLRLTLMDKDTTLELRLDNAVKESQYWQNKYEKETKVVTERYIPKFYKWCFWILIGIVLFIIVKNWKIISKFLPI